MPFIYLDMLKQVGPETGKSTRSFNQKVDPHFVVLGLYDYMHFGGIHSTIADVKALHEGRHELCWKYERQPLFLYCLQSSVDAVKRIFSNADNRSYPLVLSLLQIDKTLISTSSYVLEKYLTAFQSKVDTLLKKEGEAVVFWNLGGSDIAIAFRTETIASTARVIYSLQTEDISETLVPVDKLSVYSTSSHCAIAIHPESNTVVQSDLCDWITRDKTVLFHLLFETSHGHNGLLVHADNTHMVLGERDYEHPFPANRAQWPDFIAEYLGEPSKTEDVYHHRTTYIVPEVILNISEPPAILNKSTPLVWGCGDDEIFNILDEIHQIIEDACFAYGSTCSKNQEQLFHCRNSLLGLYKYAYRLQVTMGQYDLFCYVRRIYTALKNILSSYKEKLLYIAKKGDHSLSDISCFKNMVAEIAQQIFIVVSELQHLFSILSISPHTYMETYGSSMRSLNAATKLWDAYNGIVLALKGVFPSIVDRHQIDNTILLSPYRERQSENTQLFPLSSEEYPIVLVQMNFSLMFQPKLATYMLTHECGHHFSDSCRVERFIDMSKAYISSLLKDVFDYAIITPFYMISTIMDNTPNVSHDTYLSWLYKEYKDASDYRNLIMLDISAKSDIDFKAFFDKFSDLYRKALLVEIDASIDSVFPYFKVWYESVAGIYWKHDCYFANELKEAYIQFPDELLEKLIHNVYNRIWSKTGMFLDCLKQAADIDIYQYSKLLAFWQFIPSKKYVKAKIEALVNRQNKESLSQDIIEIFREVYADMFAVVVLKLNANEYYALFNEFSDINPPLIISQINLLRAYAVSTVAFNDDMCLLNWLNSNECAYSTGDKIVARKKLLDLIHSPIRNYIIRYARNSEQQLTKFIENNQNCEEIVAHIRNLFNNRNDAELIDTLWYFWKKSMS